MPRDLPFVKRLDLHRAQKEVDRLKDRESFLAEALLTAIKEHTDQMSRAATLLVMARGYVPAGLCRDEIDAFLGRPS